MLFKQLVIVYRQGELLHELKILRYTEIDMPSKLQVEVELPLMATRIVTTPDR